VISGRASSVERLYSIISQVGADPTNWLPMFERQP
jgi:type IV secretory pathway VirB4 component